MSPFSFRFSPPVPISPPPPATSFLPTTTLDFINTVLSLAEHLPKLFWDTVAVETGTCRFHCLRFWTMSSRCRQSPATPRSTRCLLWCAPVDVQIGRWTLPSWIIGKPGLHCPHIGHAAHVEQRHRVGGRNGRRFGPRLPLPQVFSQDLGAAAWHCSPRRRCGVLRHQSFWRNPTLKDPLSWVSSACCLSLPRAIVSCLVICATILYSTYHLYCPFLVIGCWVLGDSLRPFHRSTVLCCIRESVLVSNSPVDKAWAHDHDTCLTTATAAF